MQYAAWPVKAALPPIQVLYQEGKKQTIRIFYPMECAVAPSEPTNRPEQGKKPANDVDRQTSRYELKQIRRMEKAAAHEPIKLTTGECYAVKRLERETGLEPSP
ncbi:hypothetical protein [Agrobacterium tumefaciens]|uniref:hypothetical protein n=1 Tax=Agrobacterium tumefaciens TaxID=358 RepID=UPI0021D187B6|nr:hypothetical protein [Agrobacterium tumefaciens]UXS01814.1 hypothetical protein FY156_10195 [Agrobacterium tumefaciens]